MELKLSISGKHETERIISLMLLGLLTAMEKGTLSIEEAEGYLFNPYSFEHLEQLGLDDRVVDIVKLGCELEDVESLIPDKLQSTIQDLKERALSTLESLPKPTLPTEKLIKK